MIHLCTFNGNNFTCIFIHQKSSIQARTTRAASLENRQPFSGRHGWPLFPGQVRRSQGYPLSVSKIRWHGANVVTGQFLFPSIYAYITLLMSVVNSIQEPLKGMILANTTVTVAWKLVLKKTHPGEAVQLWNDNTFSAVDHKCTTRSHVWDHAKDIHPGWSFQNPPCSGSVTIQFQLGFKGDAVSPSHDSIHSSYGVSVAGDEIIQKFENESCFVHRRSGNFSKNLYNPSLTLFSGFVSNWKKNPEMILSWNVKKIRIPALIRVDPKRNSFGFFWSQGPVYLIPVEGEGLKLIF